MATGIYDYKPERDADELSYDDYKRGPAKGSKYNHFHRIIEYFQIWIFCILKIRKYKINFLSLHVIVIW